MENTLNLDEFTKAYIEAMLWAEVDDKGQPLDRFKVWDIAPEALEKIKADCAKFQAAYVDTLARYYRIYPITCAGHDFYLTRNFHGVGYWDRLPVEDEVMERLTTAAHAFGESSPYIGDDGKIYV